MKKSIVLALVALATASTLMGCNVSKTVTKTESHTDENGNTVTTTTTKTSGNKGTETTETTTTETAEEVAEEVEETEENEQIVATIAFANETGVDFAGLYFASSQDGEWGDDVLGDNAPLADGEMITFKESFKYRSDNSLWDVSAVDEAGESIEFDQIDMLDANDPTNILLTFAYDEEEEDYTVTIE